MEIMEICSETNSQPSRIKNWSKEEKYQLLRGLKHLENQHFEQIKQRYIPNKSKNEVRNVIEYYKIKLRKHPAFCQKIKKEKKCNNNNLVPLADWAKFLSDSLSFEDLHTETAMALRIIAEHEEFPSPFCLHNVNFRLTYHSLANVLDGKNVFSDRRIYTVLEKCLVDTALTSKAFIRQITYKTIIRTINMSDKAVNSFPKATDNNELSYIRHLASQRSYNPLNLSELYLKPSQ